MSPSQSRGTTKHECPSFLVTHPRPTKRLHGGGGKVEKDLHPSTCLYSSSRSRI
jgi:hypothetical protein